jgi:hypothetical protein
MINIYAETVNIHVESVVGMNLPGETVVRVMDTSPEVGCLMAHQECICRVGLVAAGVAFASVVGVGTAAFLKASVEVLAGLVGTCVVSSSVAGAGISIGRLPIPQAVAMA